VTQEGDTGATSAQCSRGISSVFNKALRVARDAYKQYTARKQRLHDYMAQNKRPSYKHIKVTVLSKLFSVRQCFRFMCQRAG